MADEEQLRILREGVEAWNRWRKEHPDVVRPELRMAGLSGADLRGANLSRADLGSAQLNEADLSEADLRRANLENARLRRANLEMADLEEAVLSGVHRPGAFISGAGFITAELHEARLIGANLRMADLSSVDLSAANCTSTNFTDADLSGANLSQADLSSAKLQGTKLVGANLTGANLNGADLSSAHTGNTNFSDVDLSVARGLEFVKHHDSSKIGIDTIHRSQGRIPEAFLRGVGVRDDLITYIHSLVAQDLAFHSCFISYSSKDQAFAERLNTDLQAKGVHCWFAPHDLKIGDRYRQRIDEAIRLYDKLLLILSEHSVESDWVATEVEAAFEKERQRGQTVLFPVRIDDPVMTTDQAWAADIRRTRHIGDFTRWKDHDAYVKAFERLVQDLKAG